jgi:uncharacterized protein (DUF302 family)
MSKTKTRQISVERFSITSSQSFEAVVAGIEREIGHPDMAAFSKKIAEARTLAELESAVREAIGPSGLMEFVRFDIGAVLRKEQGDRARKSLRLVVGNPLIMKEMAKHVPDAASYAPVTILIDERADGVRLSYDRMASFLAPYGSAEALNVAQELDAKIEALLAKVAS